MCAGKEITIDERVFAGQSVLDPTVRDQIEALRGADESKLRVMAADLTRKRLDWLCANRHLVERASEDILDTAYRVLLAKLGLRPEDAPIVERGPRHLAFQSRNFCPTLEACRILGLDTRFVCRHLTEGPTNELLRAIDARLRFERNYTTLRPYGDYCEERILLGG